MAMRAFFRNFAAQTAGELKSLTIYIAAFITAICAISVFGSSEADDTLDLSTPLSADSNVVADVDTTLPDTILPSILAANPDSDSVLVVPAADAPQLLQKSRIVNTKVDLDAPVVFSAADSMTIVRRDSAFMYGNSSVTYGDIQLDAAEIQMDLNHNTVFALGRPDPRAKSPASPYSPKTAPTMKPPR